MDLEESAKIFSLMLKSGTPIILPKRFFHNAEQINSFRRILKEKDVVGKNSSYH